ncbi:uncharacterized protein BDW43DRAFT_308538 [Aspergillus alliaceus]|uniref:uncharacterized protein n=1 Tax=Petromyces alliaceus TaxID=209559 RepID=UPI0012A48ACD|nr:uncharacterized protein BDW43DRAFT_308538 [Aspergillus alliaceus]KAB8236272.1 hypothetical protein BDW43DRAFT_308538 [Aspergillus alliaceus]
MHLHHHSLLSFLAIPLFPEIVQGADIQSAAQAGGPAACRQLSSAFPSLLFSSDTAIYANQSHLPWSQTCLLSPSCVFLPQDAEDVSHALRIIKMTRAPFSVIGAGHMPVPGAASIDHGVMISLHDLKHRQLSEDLSVVQIGPVRPGRQRGSLRQVGVGGLLLGGGIGYFSSQVGWGANSVVQYEVVLPDSSIVQVNAASHPVLFWALKGGSNYFGIVTRFDMKTIPLGDAFYSGKIWTSASTLPWLDALNAYLASGGGAEDVKAAIMPMIALTPSDGVSEVISLKFYADAVNEPKAFKNFTAIDGPTLLNESGVGPWTYLPTALNTPAYAAKDKRSFGPSASRRIRGPLASSITQSLIRHARPYSMSLTCRSASASSPSPKHGLKPPRLWGVDAMDLDPNDAPFIAGLMSSTWFNAADDAAVRDFSRNAANSIRQQTAALGLVHSFLCLNDAGVGQTPFRSYGNGSRLKRLQAIQREYDRDGVFHNLLAHGFLLQ